MMNIDTPIIPTIPSQLQSYMQESQHTQYTYPPYKYTEQQQIIFKYL